jgi:hypothetical protein
MRAFIYIGLLALVSACNPVIDSDDDSSDDQNRVFSVQGSVSGHTGPLTLALNVNNEVFGTQIVETGNGAFSFEKSTALNDTFSVVVQTPPDAQLCTVSTEGSGTVATDVTSITVQCSDSVDACAVYDQVLEAPEYNACHDWLDAHNLVRQQLNNDELPESPAPEIPVPLLQWDEKLATVADDYAKSCPEGHNPDRTSDYVNQGGSGYVGENLAWGYATLESAVEGWADEESDYRYEPHGSDSTGGVVGHYTQIIWRNTTHIGCATYAASCGAYFEPAYVCNYSPGGNYLGQLAY